jgi:zinc protease
VTTVVLPSQTSPFVSIRLLFTTGSADDPAGLEGLAALTGALLAEGGTRALTYEQLLAELYPMAAGIGVHVDRDVTVVHGTVHRDHLDRYYELFRQVVLEPRCDTKEFERLKDDQHNALVSGLRAVDDEGFGMESLGSLLHPGHPYGRPIEGTVRGIQGLRPEDVAEFHAARFTRDALTLGLAGYLPSGFVERVTADLLKLKERGPARAEVPVPVRPHGFDALVVTKPARAWAISLGHPLAVTRADADFFPLFLANSYLGEHRTFNGVLMTKMRTDRGLNYGDYSYVENFVQDGASTFALANVPRRRQAFTIWIRPVAAEHAHFAIRLAVRELRRLVREGLTAEAFDETREFLLSYSKLWTQTPSRRLGFAMDGAFYGGKSLVDELADRLPGMTVDDVNRAVRRHLHPESLSLAVIADPAGAEAFVDALLSNAPSPIAYATETKPDVLSEDRAIAMEPLPIERSHCRIVPADVMFER